MKSKLIPIIDDFVTYKSLEYLNTVDLKTISSLIITKSHYWIDSTAIIGIIPKNKSEKVILFVDVENLTMQKWVEFEEVDNATLTEKFIKNLKHQHINCPILRLDSTHMFEQMAEVVQSSFYENLNRILRKNEHTLSWYDHPSWKFKKD